jgi:hypothetical protein
MLFDAMLENPSVNAELIDKFQAKLEAKKASL